MTDTMAHTQPASPASPASPAPTITAPGGRFVFGGDWNPEQWDESTWADDIAKLERAGIIRPVEPAITVYGPYGRPTGRGSGRTCRPAGWPRRAPRRRPASRRVR